jgi:hypothetical protein
MESSPVPVNERFPAAGSLLPDTAPYLQHILLPGTRGFPDPTVTAGGEGVPPYALMFGMEIHENDARFRR